MGLSWQTPSNLLDKAISAATTAGGYVVNPIGASKNQKKPLAAPKPKVYGPTLQEAAANRIQQMGGVTSGGLKSTPSGITPYVAPYSPVAAPPVPPPVSLVNAVKQVPPMPVPTVSGKSYWDTIRNLGSKNAPPAASQSVVPTVPAGPDYGAMLKSLLGGLGPDYTSLIAGLQTPGKVADIATPNERYIFDEYSKPIASAYDALASQVQALQDAAVGRESAARSGLEQGFATVKGQNQTAADAATQRLMDFAKGLGIQDAAGVGQSAQRRSEQQTLLGGLSDLISQTMLGTHDTLANARQSNYDTMRAMAGGGKAAGISQLASMVATAQGQADLATQDYYSKAKLAEAQGRHDLAMQYANLAQQQQSNKMSMIKLVSDLQTNAAQMAAKLNPSTTAQQVETQKNSGVMDALAGLTGDKPAHDYLMDALYSTGSVDEAFQKLYKKSTEKPPVVYPNINLGPAMSSVLPGLAKITNAFSAQNSMSPPAADLPALLRAMNAIRQYAPSYGGTSTTTSLTSSGKG